MPLDYRNFIIPGLAEHSAIIAGERDVAGDISWDSKHRADFKLDVATDPRYAGMPEGSAKRLKRKNTPSRQACRVRRT